MLVLHVELVRANALAMLLKKAKSTRLIRIYVLDAELAHQCARFLQ